MIAFAADTHFGYEKVIHFCDRPFSNADEMNEAMTDDLWPLITARDTVRNAGEDVNSFRPVTFDELLENNRRFKAYTAGVIKTEQDFQKRLEECNSGR